VLALVPASIARGQASGTRPPSDTTLKLPAVIVTATRDSISPLNSPLPTGALTSAALRRDHGVSLSQTIARLPGVRSLSTGEQIGKPVIRGLSGSRVLVLDDGLRMEDYSWSDEDGPSIDARLAERVEVIRGPASVLYGSDALGGVVNAIPEAIPNAHGGPRIRRGDLELYGASNNVEFGGALGLEATRGRSGARLRFVGRFGQDVHTPAGAIANTGFVAGNGELAIGVHHESGAETAVRFAHFGGEYKLLEIDAPAGGAEEEEGGPARVTLDDRLQLSHRRQAGALGLEVRGQLQRHSLAEKSDLPNPEPGQPKEATVFDLLLNTATAEFLVHHGDATEGIAGHAAWRGTIGASVMAQRNASRGIIPLVPDATTTAAGLFAFERLSLGRLAFLAGARGDGRHLSADADTRLALRDQSRSWSSFSGDLGMVYQLQPTLAFSLNAGRAWRAPNLFELFANGPRLGEGRYEYGSNTLDAERSLNLDAALRWDSPRAHAEVSAFRTTVNDYIYTAPTNLFNDGLRVFRYGQSDATLTGGEVSASVASTDALTLRGRFDAVRGTRADDDPLPLMPPVRAAVGAELHGHDGRHGAPYLSADVEYVAKQSRLSAAEADAQVEEGHFPLQTDAYTLLDLGAGMSAMLAGRSTHIDLHVRNATNARYRDFLNRYKEFAYSPGVNVMLRLSTGF
jgi:outer membrane receptor protein involved in Fe transport